MHPTQERNFTFKFLQSIWLGDAAYSSYTFVFQTELTSVALAAVAGILSFKFSCLEFSVLHRWSSVQSRREAYVRSTCFAVIDVCIEITAFELQ
jgi:hypothetical protein